MIRRSFIIAVPSLIAMPTLIGPRHALAAAGVKPGRLGICTFSCHRHWEAVRNHQSGVSFQDAPSFYGYVRTLGADGVQTSVRGLDSAAVKAMRDRIEADGCYFEGDIRLPKAEADLAEFEQEVQLTREAGATVARAILTGGRRYEVFKSLAEFRKFQAEAVERLGLVEPILRKHGLKLAIENHKDLTVDEHATLMKQMSSEWIGTLVDTGNNLALLDDPYRSIEVLAPFVLSVHLKDMALQPYEDGFLLSEVPCGTGFLDLPRMASTLRKANGNIVFNLEMATREPLKIPCLTQAYWLTFPERRVTHLDAAMRLVETNPPMQPPPTIANKPMPQQLTEEESNNQTSLRWMHQHLISS